MVVHVILIFYLLVLWLIIVSGLLWGHQWGRILAQSGVRAPNGLAELQAFAWLRVNWLVFKSPGALSWSLLASIPNLRIFLCSKPSVLLNVSGLSSAHHLVNLSVLIQSLQFLDLLFRESCFLLRFQLRNLGATLKGVSLKPGFETALLTGVTLQDLLSSFHPWHLYRISGFGDLRNNLVFLVI